jgi:hypothetical protein
MKLNTSILFKMLHGFRVQDDKQACVKNFLKVITQRVIAANRFILDGQGVGNTMTCRPDHPETEALLQVLFDKASARPEELIDIRAIGNSLYGVISSMKYPSEVRPRHCWGKWLVSF